MPTLTPPLSPTSPKRRWLAHDRVNQTNDWLTPPEILLELGPFDLDPCASKPPRPWKTATVMVAPPEDGLAYKWEGRVWLNPPYGPHTKVWMEKLATYGRGTALIFGRTETSTFHEFVFGRASGLFFFRGRLSFYRPDGTPSLKGMNAGMGSVLVSYGKEDAGRLEACRLPGYYVALPW